MSTPANARPCSKLFAPVSIAPLVQIRLALGLILLWEAYRYISNDWPRQLFLDPPFLFKYSGFDWVRPLPDALHLAVFPFLAALAVAFTIGLFHRAAATLLFIGWAYVFLLDQALYLNHLYLVVTVIGLMIVLPAHRAFSLDAVWRPILYCPVVPRWTIDILRLQFAVVYIFGGIAKLNADWLSGVPMQIMLLGSADLIGQWAGEPAIALLFAYAGMLLDLAIIPLLYWKRTRALALVLAAIFHIANHILFQIGIFPWTMLAATIILWPPFPLTLLKLARLYGGLVLAGMFFTAWARPPQLAEPAVPAWAWALALITTALLIFPPDSWKQFSFERPAFIEGISKPGWRSCRGGSFQILVAVQRVLKLLLGKLQARTRPIVLAFVILFATWQILMPLRHFLYPGNVSWTEQGHRWAWQMKLRVKFADRAVFYIRDENEDLLEIVDAFAVSSPLTLRQSEVMSTRPGLALEYAHHLRDQAQAEYQRPIRITVENPVSLNGRPFQHLIDPDADLAAIKERLWPPADWIQPLTTPRRPLTRVDVTKIDGLREYIESRQVKMRNQ